MSDTYQAIYDAVRSKLSNTDVAGAAEQVFREANIGHYVEQAYYAFTESLQATQRPSAVYRPKIFMDGNQWCALYGENLQDGVCGFGDSPEKAMQDFDKSWFESLQESE